MPGPVTSVTLRLAATADAPARARQSLVDACHQLPEQLLGDAELLTSELVSNSVKHAGGPVIVAIECDGNTLSVEVRDPSPSLPVVRDPDEDSIGGRGMRLVAAIAKSWGCRRSADGTGKSVWFALVR